MASSEYGHQASFSLREKVIAEQSDEGLTVTMRISSAISGNTYPLLAIRYSLFAITCSLLTIRQIPTPTSQSR